MTTWKKRGVLPIVARVVLAPSCPMHFDFTGPLGIPSGLSQKSTLRIHLVARLKTGPNKFLPSPDSRIRRTWMLPSLSIFYQLESLRSLLHPVRRLSLHLTYADPCQSRLPPLHTRRPINTLGERLPPSLHPRSRPAARAASPLLANGEDSSPHSLPTITPSPPHWIPFLFLLPHFHREVT